jgi:hypothetical protein
MYGNITMKPLAQLIYTDKEKREERIHSWDEDRKIWVELCKFGFSTESSGESLEFSVEKYDQIGVWKQQNMCYCLKDGEVRANKTSCYFCHFDHVSEHLIGIVNITLTMLFSHRHLHFQTSSNSSK